MVVSIFDFCKNSAYLLSHPLFVNLTYFESAKNVFNTGSAFHSRNKNEAILGSLMVHPILQYLANAVTGHAIYVPYVSQF